MEGNSPAVRGSLEPCAHSVLTARHSLPIGVRMGLEHLCTRKPRQQRGGCKAELRALRCESWEGKIESSCVQVPPTHTEPRGCRR